MSSLPFCAYRSFSTRKTLSGESSHKRLTQQKKQRERERKELDALGRRPLANVRVVQRNVVYVVGIGPRFAKEEVCYCSFDQEIGPLLLFSVSSSFRLFDPMNTLGNMERSIRYYLSNGLRLEAEHP